MSSDSPFWLHSVSVVVTAEFHNPSILNQSFLVSQEIVPKDWEVEEAITTPPFSVLRYSNGIQWIVEQSKLTVSEKPESSFQDEYQVHQLANRYLEKLPHVPYRSLGLNCLVSMNCLDPQHWLIQKFLKPELQIEREFKIVGMVPKFTFALEGALLNLTFNDGEIQRGEDDPESTVLIDCNVHHEGPLESHELRAAIGQWPDLQETTVSVLRELIGEA